MRITITAKLLLSLLVIPLFFTGCLKDECKNRYTMYIPVYKSLSEVRAQMKSGQPMPVAQTGKIYVYGHYLFLNEPGKGFHIIDNSNPASPRNISFVNVPGNVDIAVKENKLYADSYTDMVVFDITNPENVTAKKFVSNVFPEQARHYSYYQSANPDSIQVLVDFIERDTTVDCATYQRWSTTLDYARINSSGNKFYVAKPNSGRGGSMARFSVVNDYLYTVSTSSLSSFNIRNAEEPKLENKQNIGWGIETIYPFKNKLFIGSTTGMFIYDLANAANPALLSQFSHARSCDPVVADDQYAYVTLRSGTLCGGGVNRLDILNIRNLSQPTLVQTYTMKNPHGLGIDGNLLFICDGKDGVKLYNAANPGNIQLVYQISGIDAFDIIAEEGLAIVVAADGLHQYQYSASNPSNIKLLSKISTVK